jgi:hypothetical protein
MDRKIPRACRIACRWGVMLWLAVGPALAALPALPAVPPLDQPNWTALSAEQKQVLAPLASEWGSMDAFRRKKWLGIAQRYPAMSPTEQASVQRNMREWAKLAPEERKQAREQYKTLKKASPEERDAVRQKWEEYTALTPEERDQLKVEAGRRPPPKTPTKPPVAPAANTPGLIAGSVPRSPLSPLKAPQSTLVPRAGKPSPPAPRD